MVPPHLQTLFERSTAKQNKEEQKAINHLLNDFQDVFSKDKYDFGKTHLVEHHIKTGDAVPVKLPPRRTPLAFAGEDQKELKKLKKWAVIQSSTSPWGVSFVMV